MHASVLLYFEDPFVAISCDTKFQRPFKDPYIALSGDKLSCVWRLSQVTCMQATYTMGLGGVSGIYFNASAKLHFC